MSIYGISLAVSFCSVFLKGFQHKNVIGMHYKLTFFTSVLMGAFDVAAVTLIVKGGWPLAITSGIGAGFGMIASMWVHSRVVKNEDRPE